MGAQRGVGSIVVLHFTALSRLAACLLSSFDLHIICPGEHLCPAFCVSVRVSWLMNLQLVH